MWTSADLKNDAKQRLQGNYWNGFVATLAAALTYGGGLSGSSSYSFSQEDFDMDQSGSVQDFFSQFTREEIRVFIVAFLTTFVIAMIISYVLRIFLGYPLVIGKVRFFIVNTKYQATTKEIGWGFRHQYTHMVGAMFIRDLKISLWSLLFVIPGIVKSYEYRMVPYVLSENPTITTKRAFEISREMTRGEKANLFVLDLSFIGWYLLGMLACCGLGLFFLYPYQEATYAEFYRIKRDEVLQRGVVKYDELCGVEQYGA